MSGQNLAQLSFEVIQAPVALFFFKVRTLPALTSESLKKRRRLQTGGPGANIGAFI
jgi:hypothetical protein